MLYYCNRNFIIIVIVIIDNYNYTASLFGSGTGSTLLGSKPATVLTTATTSKGLGGLDVSVNNKGLSQGNSSSTAAKENLLPNELMQTIDKFK